MANTYAICRLDRVSGTPDGRLKAAVDIQNGMFATQNEVTGKLDLANDSTKNVVLVASVAHQYDSMNEGDFVNKADSNLKPRSYQLEEGDIFTVTVQAVSYADETTPIGVRANFGAVVVGDKGQVSETAGNAGKLQFVASAKADSKLVVEVISKTKLNGDDAVQLKVVKN
jgi:hypothetical protein